MKLNILGFEWDFEISDDKLFSSYGGICNFEDRAIYINTKSLDMFSDTLHEIAHAHIHIAGITPPDSLEGFCVLFQNIMARLVELNGDDVIGQILKWVNSDGK